MSRVYNIELSDESIELIISGLICLNAIRELPADKQEHIELLIKMFNDELIYG